ncbi:MAG: epoxyqueuosine reductase [Desulfobacteraceae bacterium]|nr:epoxyqueuosine reductase [Desulfobacteraceae bacterium]
MDKSAWLVSMITNFVADSEVNSLNPPGGEPAFDAPLVGFSSGADPLYGEYVSHIGDFYLTPLRIFQLAFPEEPPVSPGDLTMISWVLPSTDATRQDHAAEKKQPSERWVRVRHFGEKFNETLRRHVTDRLSDAGILAVPPFLAPFWARSGEGPYAPCSNWSERHAAYAAGLGTFGLCDGLITPVGKAMRTGSVVARMSVAPTQRPYTDHHAYCLFYSHGTCGKCIPRCPVNAIGKSGHDKKKCMDYTEHAMNAHVRKTYGIDTYACGLCQAGVPCMAHIPAPEEGE